MRKVLKGSRERFDDILNNIIEKTHTNTCQIELDGKWYTIIDDKLVLCDEINK
tara:strand:+ start:8139 stop:8297 length:159 start_codon:yes stop_codon:yes gene_type:complete